MPDSFIDRFTRGDILISDGATGTMLQRAGLPVGMAPELWNLENPQAVRELHRGYIAAGANVILTNTFGGTSLKLEKVGLGDRAREINRIAATLAREEAGDQVFVLGDIGPTGGLLEPFGDLSAAQATRAFAEQAAGLVEGGVDAILIETMSSLEEAAAAVEGVKQASSLPIITTMSFDTRGRTMMGVQPGTAAKALWGMGVLAIGANCGRTLSETLTAVTEMHQAVPEATLVAKPNAGLPHLDNGELVYDVTPEVMSDYALKFAGLGVRMMGGCCGSTPDHIRAIAAALHTP